MKKRLIALDALRGLAALCVVFFHAREINWVGIGSIWHSNKFAPNVNGMVSYMTAPFYFGFAAVPLFFVISGYCIHRPNVSKLVVDANHKLNITEYFKRRLWRIYPVLIAALLLTYFFDLYTTSHFPLDSKIGDNSWRSFLINAASLQNIAGSTYGTNGPLWTLGIELHFYFLYPLLFWTTKKLGPAKTVLGVLLLSLIAIGALQIAHSDIKFFLPFWFTWAVGFFIAECEAGRHSIVLRKWIFPLLLSIFLAVILSLTKYRNLAEPFFAVAFGGLLLWSISEKGQTFWEKSWGQILARVGICSYSLYATHVPFLIFLRSLLQNGEKSHYVFVSFIFSLLSVTLAIMMFWGVERWSLKLPAKIISRT